MKEITRIKNDEEVSFITMKPTACVKCAIGQDWYQCNFEAMFQPDEFYPDYMQVCNFVRKEIDGKELNIEQAAKLLYDFLKREYKPLGLCVVNHVTGCKTHFDVDVQIGG